MRNDAGNWEAHCADPQVVTQDDLQITRVWPHRMTLISGPRARQMTDLPVIGWPDRTEAAAFALCLRRDRILEVNGAACPLGWDGAAGLAISDMSSGYACFHLDGDRVSALLRRGGVARLDQPSLSVARLMFGLSTLLYRRGASRYGILVTSMHAQTMTHRFRNMVLHHGAAF